MSLLDCTRGGFNVQQDGPPEAPVLLFSNSLTCDMTMWQPQVDALSRRFRVVRYDGRGQGGSPATPGPYTIEGLAEDALAILDALEVRQAHFCGLSMGGMVGLELLTHAPSRIGRAVLANTAAHMGPPSLWDGRIALARTGGMQAVAEPTLSRWFPAAFRTSAPALMEQMRGVIHRTPVEGYVACCEAIRDMDQRDTMRSITTPTLVIAGEHDPATTVADGWLIHEAVAGSEMVVLPTGHIAAAEMPDAFTAALDAFLAKDGVHAPPR